MISEMKWILFTIFIFNVAFASNEVQDECVVCYECFPVSFKFSCGHEVCAVCAESILKLCDNKKCISCRAILPEFVEEWLTMIKINPIYLTPDTPLKHLQIVFPLICSVDNLTTITQCVKMDVKINSKGFLGFFPIHLASHKDVLKYLVDNGANVNKKRFDGLTPLYMNSEIGNLPAVQWLIENGANVNEVNNHDSSSLSVSSHEGHLPVVKYLVENKADLHQFNNDGESPLFISSQEGHLPVVKYLTENGANVNQARNDGVTPLFMSSYEGHLPVVKYLTENGANVNQARNDGVTPLAIAISNNQIEVAKFLLKTNADIEATHLFFEKNNSLEYINILDKLCKEMENGIEQLINQMLNDY